MCYHTLSMQNQNKSDAELLRNTKSNGYNLTNLDRQERYREDVKTLHKCGIDIIKVNYYVNLYLADINKLITQRINNVKDIFPDWIRWDYIRPLFIMPRGQKEKLLLRGGQYFRVFQRQGVRREDGYRALRLPDAPESV